jgi:integrase
VSVATVVSEIGTLRPIWTWGIGNGLLPDGPNPFAGMSPRGSKGAGKERDPFNEAEAAMILEAARRETGWLRWVPWVLAFTGARLGEICDANAGDVREVSGVWCLDVRPSKSRTLKTPQSQRLVPLADALLAEGFLDHARALPAGSALFPDLAVGEWGKRSSIATKTLGRRLRALGIKDDAKVAGHSWRHRMKDLLRFARIPPEAADAILGHDNPTNAGSGYGDGWRGRPDETKVELEKGALVPEGLAVGT